MLPTSEEEDAHGGPKLSGNSACLCSPARTILQHFCSLNISSWHRTCYSNHLSAHHPLLSTTGFQPRAEILPQVNFKLTVQVNDGMPRVWQNCGTRFLCALPGRAAGSSGTAAWDRRSEESFYPVCTHTFAQLRSIFGKFSAWDFSW